MASLAVRLCRGLNSGVMRALNALGVRLYLVERGGGRDVPMPKLAPGYTVEQSDPERLRPWADTPLACRPSS